MEEQQRRFESNNPENEGPTSSFFAPLNDQGKMYTDQVDKANILNRQYESIFTKEAEDERVKIENDTKNLNSC